MPAEGLEWLPKRDILSYEEIAAIVRQLAPLGLRRLRITGGEPTIRPDLAELIAMLKAVPGIEDIALSTNGVKLPALAAELRAAGLDRVNISADSLRAERISAIARRNLGFDPVTAALAAERAGLSPVKLNMVVLRGVNDDEVEDFARLTMEHPWHVRFIELDAGRRDARSHVGARGAERRDPVAARGAGRARRRIADPSVATGPPSITASWARRAPLA